MNFDPARGLASQLALELHKKIGYPTPRSADDRAAIVAAAELAVLDSAETFLAWLRGPSILRLTAGPVRNQSTGLPSGTPNEGAPMQIHDDEQFDYTLHELDAKGFETDAATPPTWTSSDEAAVPLNVSADGKTFHVVAGAPGTALITASVTLADGSVLPISDVVEVRPEGAATASLTAGPVSTQPAPAPAPADVPASPAPADTTPADVPAESAPVEAVPADAPVDSAPAAVAAPDQPFDPSVAI